MKPATQIALWVVATITAVPGILALVAWLTGLR